MPRPRIEGMDERIVESFVSRGIYPSQKIVIHEALKSLVREQKRKEAAECGRQADYSESTYSAQLSSLETEQSHAPVGHLARKTKVR